jgi:hypothetical protein
LIVKVVAENETKRMEDAKKSGPSQKEK